MAYFKRRKKGEPRTIPLNAEAQRAIQEQLRKFREKFGRDTGPEDPIFFDPDADTPQPISKAGLNERSRKTERSRPVVLPLPRWITRAYDAGAIFGRPALFVASNAKDRRVAEQRGIRRWKKACRQRCLH